MLIHYTVKFLQSSALANLCRQHNQNHVAALHYSFANMNRFSTIIHKQRLLHYSKEREIQEVIHEYLTKHDKKMNYQYIQNVYHDEDKIMIICFFNQQAHMLLSLKIFEIDMSFKRIAIKNLNEIVFAVYSSTSEKEKLNSLLMYF